MIVEPLTAGWPTIDLEQLDRRFAWSRRFDTKYVLSADQAQRLLQELAGRTRVLEVRDSTATEYRTVYFDTPDLRTYRAHVQGRRRRFKLRTREYVGQDVTFFEVKLKDPRGRTVKHRRRHPPELSHLLTDDAVRFAEGIVAPGYGFAAGDRYAPTLVTSFWRVTLADVATAERITFDEDLTIDGDGHRFGLGYGRVVVEVKGPTPTGPTVRSLRSLRIAPTAMSKYGLGVTLLHAQGSGSRWRSAIAALGGLPEPVLDHPPASRLVNTRS